MATGAISRCESCTDQFVSPIFTVPKKDGSSRLILNLKSLNRYVETPHFKLENIKAATVLITADSFLATVDLQDAYHLVAIHKDHRKYLRFKFENVLYEYNCLPFGLSSAPYAFTKLMKPIIALLRSMGYISIVYLDDFLLISNSYELCKQNVAETIRILTEYGFIINYNKSRIEPAQVQTFLGFVLNAKDLCLSLPQNKQEFIKMEINDFMRREEFTIAKWAHLVGLLVACCPAIKYGWGHTKELEAAKCRALSNNHNNYEARMSISELARTELVWWESHLNSYNPIRQFTFKIVISTDASPTGWGACCNGEEVSGVWKAEEREFHINYLELVAAFFGLKCFASRASNIEILLRIDNTTAISYINRMGGTKYAGLNAITRQIWKFCEQRNIWIFASYVASKDNEADEGSRRLEPETEWQLADDCFRRICNTFGTPSIDLFASRANTKCSVYVSWGRDPGAIATDAFTRDWSCHFLRISPFLVNFTGLSKNIKRQG